MQPEICFRDSEFSSVHLGTPRFDVLAKLRAVVPGQSMRFLPSNSGHANRLDRYASDRRARSRASRCNDGERYGSSTSFQYNR
jgi:hypothetical protein